MIYAVQAHHPRALFEGGETITCTTEHPFYVQGKGWVATQDLKPNDKLELRDGEDAFVDAVRYEKLDKPIPVFNFEVEGFHTYFVGVGCVLVHNSAKHWIASHTHIRGRHIPFHEDK